MRLGSQDQMPTPAGRASWLAAAGGSAEHKMQPATCCGVSKNGSSVMSNAWANSRNRKLFVRAKTARLASDTT